MPLFGVQTGPIVCREDDLDPLELIDFAEAFGFTVEQPSERERRAHREARASDVAGPQTHNGKDPS